MIPKSNIHGSGGNLADYLVKGGDGEKAELIQVRGFAADDIKTAFLTIQAIAETHTNCEKPFLHSYYRLAPGEELTKEQWLETADRMEVALGLVGQPRAVAFHYVEDGSTHMHVGWSRIDEEKMRAIDPGLYINKQMEVARELEKQFGLRQLDSERDPDRGGPANRAEFEEARRLRSDLNAIRQDVRDSYLQSDSGAAFKAALEDKGLILAQGEKRDFVILDQDGGLHALGKRLVGETAEDIRGKLGDLDKASLPTVDQARAGIERGGYNFAAASLGAIRDEISADRGQQLRDIRRDVSAAWTNTEDGQGFAAALEEKGFTLARGDRRDFVILDQEGNPYDLARVVEGARTADIRSRMADIDRASLPSVANARAAIEARGDVAEGKAAADGTQAPASSPEAIGEKPLSVTAGEIRLAYTLSESGKSFAEGLEDRGISLAVVTPDEAAASQRLAAFARQVGNFATAYGEGELVAVNNFGGVYRLDERTTGDSKDEVQNYLATVDRTELLGVTETRDVMREANRTSFIHEQALNRPLSSIESRIEEIRSTTQTPAEFVAEMQSSGLYLARADKADLEAIRAEYPPSDKLNAAALKIEEGELVAINSFGGIHRLQSPKFDSSDLAALWQQGSDQRFGSVESIASVRGDLLEARADGAAIWDRIREERDANRLGDSTVEHAGTRPSVGDALDEVADGAAGIAQGVSKGFEKALEAVARPVEIFANIIADMFGASKGEAKAAPAEPVQLSPAEERQQRYKALAALDRIAESLRTDGKVSPADVQSLTPAHLQGIKEGGPEYLIRLAQWHESAKERDRQDELGRERER